MTAGPSVEPRWRRLGPDERRSDILSAAVRAFGEKPFAEVQMSAIAADAGVARALVHHYFGTKRDLYLEVVRAMMFVPPLDEVRLPSGSVRERVEAVVSWFVTAMSAHGKAWVAVGVDGDRDPELQALFDEADDQAAERTLDALDITGPGRRTAVAVVRAYGGMTKAAMREWLVRGELDDAQVRLLLDGVLLALVENVLPGVIALADQ